ncbi:MAG TPA: archaellin/type IV pilin N-terminal domain-containing protein, partial [Candidatus Binatia bacterium]|nr:archaellin/type IV pilin N-terminal domain-containing protein [Candidatus Binatia bacterium]
MTTNPFKKRRGLSPAITTLIILGIAVIAGVAVFQNFQSQSSVASARGAITVENLALIKNPSGELWLSAT